VHTPQAPIVAPPLRLVNSISTIVSMVQNRVLMHQIHVKHFLLFFSRLRQHNCTHKYNVQTKSITNTKKWLTYGFIVKDQLFEGQKVWEGQENFENLPIQVLLTTSATFEQNPMINYCNKKKEKCIKLQYNYNNIIFLLIIKLINVYMSMSQFIVDIYPILLVLEIVCVSTHVFVFK